MGRYRRDGQSGIGTFRYAPSYFDQGLPWSIDPINLPLQSGRVFRAPRYEGLHDVLRDAGPDAWGQALIRRRHEMPFSASALDYLIRAGNGERWGALAVGGTRQAAVARLASPRLDRLADLVRELRALAEGRRAVHPDLRRKLIQSSASLGGARPKTTVVDERGQPWLVKPRLSTDLVDVPPAGVRSPPMGRGRRPEHGADGAREFRR